MMLQIVAPKRCTGSAGDPDKAVETQSLGRCREIATEHRVKRQCLPARAPVSERSARSPSPGEPTATQGGQHMSFYGGLDWGGIAHAVCVVDGAGQVVARIEARHDAAGLVDILARLRKIAPPDRAADRPPNCWPGCTAPPKVSPVPRPGARQQWRT